MSLKIETEIKKIGPWETHTPMLRCKVTKAIGNYIFTGTQLFLVGKDILLLLVKWRKKANLALMGTLFIIHLEFDDTQLKRKLHKISSKISLF